MNLKIRQNWFSVNENNKIIWEIKIEKEYTDLWYKEIMRRFDLLSKIESESKKQKFMKSAWCYDIDETYECWEIWLPHLIELLKFINNDKNNKR